VTEDQDRNIQDATECLTRQFLKYQQLLLAYIRTLVVDHHLAEDILQETAVTLIRRAKEFGAVRNFWALAREIARRQALVMLEKQAKAPRSLPEDVLDAIDAGFDSLEREGAWDQDVLLGCLNRLPQLWQQIIQQRYWVRHSVKQIAENIGSTANTVSVTLCRARLRLADCVSRHRRLRQAL
jgi:RNA polymerase sigma-70 factor (ECF subfamily)